MYVFLLICFLCSEPANGQNLSADLTYSKYRDPACLEEEVTFTCSIIGNTLQWILNNDTGEPLWTYNIGDTCGNFTERCRNDFKFTFLLASSINRSDGLFNCTSLMTMKTSSMSNLEGVEIRCVTYDDNTTSPTNATASVSFNVLGKQHYA